MAATATMRFNGTAAQARDTARNLVAILAGSDSRGEQIARGVWYALGFAALQDIQNDFITMARGGVGEAGNVWAPLRPETLAYHRRFGRGEQADLKRAYGLGPKHRYAPGDNKGLLTKQQLARWRKIFSQAYHRLMMSYPDKVAKARAAGTAWIILKKEGARTKLQVYGNRTVEILRDTGLLFNSLTPGVLDDGGYSLPTLEGGTEQICRLIAGGVIVGSNLPYAATHNYGDPSRNIPARTFLPAVIPQVWRDRWTRFSGEALVVAARLAYEGQQ
jgi:hypothetical protein